MIDNQLLTGSLVRLTAEDPETDAPTLTRWQNDTEFSRLLETQPVLPGDVRHWKELLGEAPNDRSIFFGMRTRENDQLIGYCGAFVIRPIHGDCFVGIGIGERALWSKGYGSDAMRVLLRYLFDELNMHRVSLMVVAGNARAIRSYEKCGFVREGALRRAEQREGERRDMVFMGILRADWEKSR